MYCIRIWDKLSEILNLASVKTIQFLVFSHKCLLGGQKGLKMNNMNYHKTFHKDNKRLLLNRHTCTNRPYISYLFILLKTDETRKLWIIIFYHHFERNSSSNTKQTVKKRLNPKHKKCIPLVTKAAWNWNEIVQLLQYDIYLRKTLSNQFCGGRTPPGSVGDSHHDHHVPHVWQSIESVITYRLEISMHQQAMF